MYFMVSAVSLFSWLQKLTAFYGNEEQLLKGALVATKSDLSEFSATTREEVSVFLIVVFVFVSLWHL